MDIVERLRLVGIGSEIGAVTKDRQTAREAADQIERLREALIEMIYAYPYSPPCHDWQHQVKAHIMAREALKGSK